MQSRMIIIGCSVVRSYIFVKMSNDNDWIIQQNVSRCFVVQLYI